MTKGAQQLWLFCGVCVVAAILIVFITRQRLTGTVAPGLRFPTWTMTNKVKATKENKGDDVNQSWEKQQVLRKDLLRNMCSTVWAEADTYSPRLLNQFVSADQEPLSTKYFLHLFVIESHKLIYCGIPKVAGTSWFRLFVYLSGNYSSMEDMGQMETAKLMAKTYRRLSSYPLEEARKLLESYRKFLFVRNPFERTLSGYQFLYQSDIMAKGSYRKIYGEKIIRAVGGSPMKIKNLLAKQRTKSGGYNITFAQFAKYVSASRGPKYPNLALDHWTQMYAICHPCLIDYDWIGHFESLRTDADSILKAAGIDIRFPNFSTNPTGSSRDNALLRYYSTLTTSEIENLYKHYALDFSLFGFDIPPIVRGLLDERGTPSFPRKGNNTAFQRK